MIYAVLWNCCNSFGHCRAILVEGREKERKQGRSQKIDDLPILATCQSGTFISNACKVNDPVAYGSTRND